MSKAINASGLVAATTTVRKYGRFHHAYFLGMAIITGGLHINWSLGLEGGMAIITGGLHINWSLGLEGGFVCYLAGLFAASLGYLLLMLCEAELTSILPFSGGVYGFTRVTLGNFAGYVVGYCDAFRFMTHVIHRLFIFGEMITFLTGFERHYEPIYWFICFVTFILADSLGSERFWNLIVTLSVLAIVATLLFLLGSPAAANFSQFVPHQALTFDFTFNEFMRAMLRSARVYMGIATLPLCCDEMNEPRKSVPTAMVCVTTSMMVLSLACTFAACSLYPGVEGLVDTHFPLVYGFAKMYSIPASTAVLFSLPAVYATCFGFAYSYGRLMCAMARSGLLPTFMSKVSGERESPYIAMIGGNMLTFVVMLAIFFSGWNDAAVVGAGLLGTLVTNVSVFASFIIFRFQFTSLPKLFANHLGIPSAILGMGFFIMPIVVEISDRESGSQTIGIFFGFLLLTLIGYYRVRDTQRYSPQEQSILLVLYVMKANRMRKKQRIYKYVPVPVVRGQRVLLASTAVTPSNESMEQAADATLAAALSSATATLSETNPPVSTIELEPVRATLRVKPQTRQQGSSNGTAAAASGAGETAGEVERTYRVVHGSTDMSVSPTEVPPDL